jgi:hypothetical protein
VRDFLEAHPKVRFHFTPTYSSWLNQVEIWFVKIQRDVIDRGVFIPVADLSRKIRKYIQCYAKSAKPFRWTYTDPTRPTKPNPTTRRPSRATRNSARTSRSGSKCNLWGKKNYPRRPISAPRAPPTTGMTPQDTKNVTRI